MNRVGPKRETIVFCYTFLCFLFSIFIFTFVEYGCPRIIISHSYPYKRETNSCAYIDVGYHIYPPCHRGNRSDDMRWWVTNSRPRLQMKRRRPRITRDIQIRYTIWWRNLENSEMKFWNLAPCFLTLKVFRNIGTSRPEKIFQFIYLRVCMQRDVRNCTSWKHTRSQF